MYYRRNQNVDEDYYDPFIVLLPCKYCKRTFKQDIVQRHQKICIKNTIQQDRRLKAIREEKEKQDSEKQNGIKQLSELLENKERRRSSWRSEHSRFIKEVKQSRHKNNSFCHVAGDIRSDNSICEIDDLISTNSVGFANKIHAIYDNDSLVQSSSSDENTNGSWCNTVYDNRFAGSFDSLESFPSFSEKNNHYRSINNLCHVKRTSSGHRYKPNDRKPPTPKQGNKMLHRVKSVPNINATYNSDNYKDTPNVKKRYDSRNPRNHPKYNEHNDMLKHENAFNTNDRQYANDAYEELFNSNTAQNYESIEKPSVDPEQLSNLVIEALKNYKAQNSEETDNYLKKINKVVSHYQEHYWRKPSELKSTKPTVTIVQEIPSNLSIHRQRLERFKVRNRQKFQQIVDPEVVDNNMKIYREIIAENNQPDHPVAPAQNSVGSNAGKSVKFRDFDKQVPAPDIKSTAVQVSTSTNCNLDSSNPTVAVAVAPSNNLPVKSNAATSTTPININRSIDCANLCQDQQIYTEQKAVASHDTISKPTKQFIGYTHSEKIDQCFQSPPAFTNNILKPYHNAPQDKSYAPKTVVAENHNELGKSASKTGKSQDKPTAVTSCKHNGSGGIEDVAYVNAWRVAMN